MIVVTSGIKYTDIDGLASAIAYADLLKLQGKKALAVLVGPLNHSVTKTVRYWGLDYANNFHDLNNDFVLVNISEASHFPTFVNQNRIIRILDNHYGFEKFWEERLSKESIIEPVGSCATLIWEQYRKTGLKDKIKTVDACLLAAAIVSNTLDFKANVTKLKDIAAFKELEPKIGMEEGWIRQYFEEQEDKILEDVMDAVIRDTKVQHIPNLKMDVVAGQLEFWDARLFMENNRKDVKNALESFDSENWFFVCPSIEEGKTYLYSENETIKNLLSKAMRTSFHGDIAETNKLYLRKEVLKNIYGLK